MNFDFWACPLLRSRVSLFRTTHSLRCYANASHYLMASFILPHSSRSLTLDLDF
ncbi:MAG: hypothetical protein RML94_01915 [Bacteroidia bacterium]|nr:hypothetical protein [Bacteroidia bacterium]